VLAEEGKRGDADAIVDELFALKAKLVPALVTGFGTGIIDLAWLARDLGREQELLSVLETAPDVQWVLAARAVASGNSEGAAVVLAEIGCPPGEAYTRLRTAQSLAAAGRKREAQAHLDAALSFYAGVRATRFIAEGEALQATLAKGAPAHDISASAG
jgi:hypothetical protein